MIKFRKFIEKNKKGTIPAPIHYRHYSEQFDFSLQEKMNLSYPSLSNWVSRRENSHLSDKVDDREYNDEVGKKINLVPKKEDLIISKIHKTDILL